MCVNDKINKYIFLYLPSFLHKRQHAIILLYILLFSITVPGDFSISKSSENPDFSSRASRYCITKSTVADLRSLWLLGVWLFSISSCFAVATGTLLGTRGLCAGAGASVVCFVSQLSVMKEQVLLSNLQSVAGG